MTEKIKEAVLARCVEKDGKKTLSCAVAFEIAKEMGVKPALVGKVCNEEKIKLGQCQLGCF